MVKKWTADMDAVLLERFSDELNADLCRELGCGVRTLERHARKLGLEKSAEFRARCLERTNRGALLWYEYMRITGQKVGNHGSPGRKFEKGHRFEGEVEERRVKALRDRSEDERRRIINGWQRKTRWPMVDYATGKKV